jgi:hypothetical protein
MLAATSENIVSMKLSVPALACLLVLMSRPCQANLVCNQPAGHAVGPLVQTAETAKAIYLDIARGRRDQIELSNDVLALDEGDHWAVTQFPKKVPGREKHNGAETVGVVAGGGTLELEINKCDGHALGSYSK